MVNGQEEKEIVPMSTGPGTGATGGRSDGHSRPAAGTRVSHEG